MRYILKEQEKLEPHEIEFHGMEDLYKQFARQRQLDEVIIEKFKADDELKKLNKKIYPEPVYNARPDGYKGVHIALSLNSSEFGDIQCEVQIGTAMGRVLADKTHDLIYKERGIEEVYRDLTSNIGNNLFQVDNQTEIVRKEIVQKKEGERARKRDVYIDHIRGYHKYTAIDKIDVKKEIKQLFEKTESYITDKEELEKIQQAIGNRINSFCEEEINYDVLTKKGFTAEILDEAGKKLEEKELGFDDIVNNLSKEKKLELLLDELIGKVKKAEKKASDFQEYRTICEITSILAMSDDYGRFDDLLLNYSDIFIQKAKTSSEKTAACYVKAMVLYGLGRFKEAFEILRSQLWKEEKTGSEDSVKKAAYLNTCAYFAAERIDELKRLGIEALYPNEKDEIEKLEKEGKQLLMKTIEILNRIIKINDEKISKKGETTELKNERNPIEWVKVLTEDTKIYLDIVCSNNVEDIGNYLLNEKKLFEQVENNDNFTDRQKRLMKGYYIKHVKKAAEKLMDIINY